MVKQKPLIQKNPALGVFVIILGILIAYGSLSLLTNEESEDKSPSTNVGKEVDLKENTEISKIDALSLCYKKAKECSEKESNMDAAHYYELALKESCLQIYSAYSGIEDSSGILKYTKELC